MKIISLLVSKTTLPAIEGLIEKFDFALAPFLLSSMIGLLKRIFTLESRGIVPLVWDAISVFQVFLGGFTMEEPVFAGTAFSILLLVVLLVVSADWSLQDENRMMLNSNMKILLIVCIQCSATCIMVFC